MAESTSSLDTGDEAVGDNIAMLENPVLGRPYKRSVNHKKKGSWKPNSRQRGGDQSGAVVLTRCGACALVVFIVVVAIIAMALGYTAGYLVEHYAKGNSEAKEDKYNWGEKVTVDGSPKKVSDIFATMLNESDIRSFLS